MIDYFLNYDVKSYHLSVVVSFIFDILRRITTFTECISVFSVVVASES